MSATADPLRKSVVKVFTVQRRPNFFQPWSFHPQRSSGGSACVLEGNRILTNAHVVANATFVQVLKTGDTRKVTARIEFIDHDRELALLRVDEPGFFDDTAPVRFGSLPARQERLSVYGFPIGGNELCVTEGVVSRIEVHRYTHAFRNLLAIQTDAAINPGNSGGPVFQDDRLIGVAFQGYRSSEAEKIGYVVPTSVVQQFLQDVGNGKCDGLPSLGIFWQRTESAALRESFGLGPDDSGILVTRVVYGSSADGKIRERDIITAIEGVEIARDGSVPLRGEDRVSFVNIVNDRQIGDSIRIDLIREGKREQIKVELGVLKELVRRPTYLPSSYYIFAGFVFLPLTFDFLHEWHNPKDVDPRYRHYCTNELPSADRKQIVLLNQVLAHDINVGYHHMTGVVDRINGIRITEMNDLVRAFESRTGSHHSIEIDNHAGQGGASDFHSAAGTTIVFSAEGAESATREIITRYGIAVDRSADMSSEQR